MRYGSIYVVTNSLTGEQYVGQTRQSVQKRWAAHWRTAICSKSKKAKFQIALTKFGQDAFEIREVFVAFDAETLNSAEIKLIAELQPVYNASRGGKGLRPVVVTEETKRKRSERLKRQWSNPEWKAEQIKKLKQMSATPEASLRGRRVAIHGSAARARHIFCPEMQCSFLSVSAAAKHLGLSRSGARHAIAHKIKARGQYTLQEIVL
jgi:group I intron endonuclease